MKKSENADFPLVELIVVIAILGILAGVGTVAYTGYVERANRSADDQLISEIEYALTLGRYQDAGCDGIVTVYNVSANKDAEAKGKDATPDATVALWMTASFGSGWESLRLKYYDKYPFPAYDASLTAEQVEMVRQFKTSNLHKGIDSMPGLTAQLSRNLSSILPLVDGNSLLTLKKRSSITDAELEAYGIDENSSQTEIANVVVKYMAKQFAEMTEEDIIMEARLSMGAYSPNKLKDTKYWNADGKRDLISATTTYALLAAYANSEYASAGYKEAFYGANIQSLTDVYDLVPTTYGGYDSEAVNYDKYSKANGTITKKSTDEEIKQTALYNDLLALQNAMSILHAKENQFDVTDPAAFDNETTVDLMNAILAQG